jgi:sterol desaturase/sphingolipid hydroxylase (fatty acid hydroxylase superfamily)
MLLDFIGAYLIHQIEHKVPWMWRFHVIHHTDEQVDTTTALRHHPGESIFRAVFTILAIWISGAPIWMVMIYQSISAILSQFNHSNIKIPLSIDKYINWLIVTPNVHRSHHHFERPITDTNYGNIFTIWDRLFKTYRFVPTEKVKYGLDVYDDDPQSIATLLKVPLRKDKFR